MDAPYYATGKAIISVGLAFIVGSGLFWLIYSGGKTISDYGMKFMAWMVLTATVVTFPRYFRNFDSENLIVWLLATSIFGIVAFGIGCIYGAFKIKSSPSGDNIHAEMTEMTSNNIKDCPYCAEEIQTEAIKNVSIVESG